MSRRVYMRNDRLIVSLSGYDAGPNLPDAYKSFDSNWDWTGTLVASGAAADPSSPGSNAYNTSDASPMIILLPTLPSAARRFMIFINYYTDGDRSRNDASVELNNLAYISGSNLIVGRLRGFDNYYQRWANYIAWKVFSV